MPLWRRRRDDDIDESGPVEKPADLFSREAFLKPSSKPIETVVEHGFKRQIGVETQRKRIGQVVAACRMKDLG